MTVRRSHDPKRSASNDHEIGSIDCRRRSRSRPMAGMTDTAFRRLVKRQGGCGLVVTEMVSSEGLVRGIDRTLEYAEYTEEERPVSIQIFGGDPEKMAAAAQIVEGMGADIVDVNMGCPVPKIAKHNAGCSLMREPEHAAERRARDDEGREDSGHGEDARGLGRQRDQCAGAGAGASRMPARRRSRCTAARRRSRTRASPTGTSSPAWQRSVSIPVFGSGDCIEPEQIVERLGAAAWPACSSAAARCAIRGSSSRPRTSPPAARRAQITDAERGAVPARLHRAAAARARCTRPRDSVTSRPARRTPRSSAGPRAVTSGG